MLTILQGDALTKLRELPDESVQCCVTSPPFWGLRDYGTARWESGDLDCDHIERNARGDSGRLSTDDRPGINPAPVDTKFQYRNSCGKCGARRIDAQLGLEKTPEEYVAKLVEAFREVRRVLRKDGTLWLNLGDSYASAWPCNRRNEIGNGSLPNGKREARPPRISEGLKEKDLVGIPWMVAFALRADGWWLRSDIIWAKPNPMPESVTDRPTKSHEYIFLLTKSARYFYDAEAIKEKANGWNGSEFHDGKNLINHPDVGKVRKTWKERKANGEPMRHGLQGAAACGSGGYGGEDRNKRSVWRVATSPYPEAHFATYPPDLIKPCILAGTKPGDVVLDPFAGSGTTGQVALDLGRCAILIELNGKYLPLIEQRTNVTAGLALTSGAGTNPAPKN